MQDPAQPSDPHQAVLPPDVAADPFPQIPGYRIRKRLGQGGMATVYLATQESLDRPVSIKLIADDALLDELSKQRFENEARTIAKLNHPGIVVIHDVGRTADGRLYYSMPYLANGDLAQRDLRTDAQIVDVLRPLLSALDYAHARGIVHRDVKRENVLFDSDNRPLLTDFGIALHKSDEVRITTAGMAVGSAAYMAPEQARGDVVDRRADLYSVGVLAFELLAGELPFRSSDALAMALMHAQDAIPRLPAARSHWQGFIDRAMAKSPDRRYDNAAQMLAALDGIGRRSGSNLSSLALRTYDRTMAAGNGKRTRLFAIGAALVVGLAFVYAARDRLLPRPSSASAPARVAAPAPLAPKLPASNSAVAASPPVAPPASTASDTAEAAAVVPASTASDGNDKTASKPPEKSQKKTARPSTSHRRAKRPGAFHRFWNRLKGG